MGLREKFIEATKQTRRVEPVSVDGWNGDKAFVCELTAGERDRWEAYLTNSDEANPNGRASLIAMTLCSADGTRLFDIADAAVLAALPYHVATPLIVAAKRINGMDKEVAKKAEDFQEKADAGTDVPSGGNTGDDGN